MKQKLFIQFAIALIAYVFLWELFLFSPIRVFFVAIHESMHALATILTGGSVEYISLDGYEGSMRPSVNGVVPIVAVAGYLGSALLGSLLILTKHRKFYLITLTIFIFSFITYYIDSFFSFEYIGVILIIGLLFSLIYYTDHENFISGVIGSLLALGSIQDIKMYLFAIPSETDAGILARYFGFEILTLPISIIMFIFTIYLYYFVIKKVFNYKS